MERMCRVKGITLLLLFPLFVAGCGSLGSQGHKRHYINHTVQPGDTLYSISWRYGYDHREVAAWNRIRPPYHIYPGQKLIIISPSRNAKTKQSTTASNSTRTGNKTSSSKSSATRHSTTPAKTASLTKNQKKVTKPDEMPIRKIVWGWPTTGKVITKFVPAKGEKGLDIQGTSGQSVIAAADGNVVYSGKGLIGYGNLIIIKHNDVYLSAYGHNRRLLVKEGVKVKKGEKIAEMGGTNKDGPILHFEIRKHGKPVNPLWYLPK